MNVFLFALAALLAQSAPPKSEKVIVIHESVICTKISIAERIARDVVAAIKAHSPKRVAEALDRSLREGCKPFSIEPEAERTVWAQKPSYEEKTFILGYDTYVRVTPVTAGRGKSRVRAFLVLVGQDVTQQIREEEERRRLDKA